MPHRHATTVRLRWEGGHRLPHLPGKCTNLHGHSWQAHITLTAPALDDYGMVADFTTTKNHLQDWVDDHLDHAMMLGAADPYAARLSTDGLKVHTFGTDPHTHHLAWPTVEAVAEMLARLTEDTLPTTTPTARLERVVVSETENNTAEARR